MAKLNSKYTLNTLKKDISRNIYDKILFVIEEEQSLYIYEKEQKLRNILLKAIGNYLQEYHLKILYITAKEFIDDYNKLDKIDWKKKYSNFSKLLVEDIQCIEEATEDIRDAFLEILEEDETFPIYVTCSKEQSELNSNFGPGLGIEIEIDLK